MLFWLKWSCEVLQLPDWMLMLWAIKTYMKGTKMHGYPLIDEARKETRKNHENATKKREKHENKSREHEKTTKIPRKARKHHEQHENAFLASKDESHENTKTVKNVKTVKIVKIVKIVIFTREKPVWPWKTGMAVKIWYGLLFWFSWSWAVWLWKRWSNGPPGTRVTKHRRQEEQPESRVGTCFAKV